MDITQFTNALYAAIGLAAGSDDFQVVRAVALVPAELVLRGAFARG